MLLPSALPCEIPSRHHHQLRRSARSLAAPPSPPIEESRLATGLLQTCRRLQAILSVERLSPAPTAASAPAAGVRKSRRTTARTAVSTIAESRPNKRKRTLPNAPSTPTASSTSSSSETESRDRNLFVTPKQKRPRLTTPPPPPSRRGRGRRRQIAEEEGDSDLEDDDDGTQQWTDEEDRLLVEMVLGKLNLSRGEWDECARNLGKKDGRCVGKRWEDLLGNVVLRERRRESLRRGKRRRT